MRAVIIGANGWVRGIDLDAAGHRAGRPATLALWHNLDLWYSDEATSAGAEPNMAAMGLALAVSDHGPDDVPLIFGDAIAIAVDPDTATPDSMTPQQYHALSYALLSSLAA